MATETVKIVISAVDRTKVAFGSASRGLRGVKTQAGNLLKTLIGPLGLTVGLAGLAFGLKSIITSTADV